MLLLVVLLSIWLALGKGVTPDDTCAADGTCEAPAAKRKSRKSKLKSRLHPEYHALIKEYPFQPVINQRGEYVNIILVRSPFRSNRHMDLHEKFKDEILFLGMCSFEDFPLPASNPYSPGKNIPADFYVGRFPGFLHMFRDPEKIFPKHVKLLLMSQSDFALPYPPRRRPPKRYDFTFSGSDQDVAHDCKGWSSYAKNWTFVKEALKVMCGEYNLTGVLVATKDKQNKTACRIPKSCKGKILQTPFLEQKDYFSYLMEGRFAFLPQIHDASPRVTTQALMHDVPLLMNRNIIGGWKYVNDKTGEFFNDMSDFRDSLDRIMQNLANYTPLRWVSQNYGDAISGPRFKKFIDDNFADRVKLPKGTTMLMPTGA
jgi:hypothetical protein